MKKIISICAIIIVVVYVVVQLLPLSAKAQDLCNKCFWNPDYQDCRGSGTICCGSCDTSE